MHLNKKLIVAVGLISGAVVLASMTAIKQQPQQQERKLVNIKVLPKKMTYQQVDHLMDEWASALGVRCNFCHAQDKASDEKPEKIMARHMYEMTAKINKKYFEAKKDSLGAVMESSINCYTCHHGTSHPEISLAKDRPRPQRPPGQGRPAGAPAQGGAGTPPANGGGMNGGPGGTPASADKKP